MEEINAPIAAEEYHLTVFTAPNAIGTTVKYSHYPLLRGNGQNMIEAHNMGIVKIRRPRTTRLIGLTHLPVYDVYTINGVCSTVTEMRFLYSMAGKKRLNKGEAK